LPKEKIQTKFGIQLDELQKDIQVATKSAELQTVEQEEKTCHNSTRFTQIVCTAPTVGQTLRDFCPKEICPKTSLTEFSIVPFNLTLAF
jgi:hypothetical protein